MTTVAVIMLAVCVGASLWWLWREAQRAPDGYEDQHGFHSRTQNNKETV